jgi:antitoxin (DNA-binding transcriptional repressor) of toxin-antitoxin stability system
METPLKEQPAMVQITLEEVSNNLLSYLQRVQAGESFVVVAAGQPIAEIKPLPNPNQPTALDQFQAMGLVGCMDGQEESPTDHPDIREQLNRKRQQGRL